MQPQTLHKLLQDLEQELLRLGYTKGSMTFYRNRWQKLEDFADRNGQIYYTEQLGIDFVREYFGITQNDFSRTLNQAQTQELRRCPEEVRPVPGPKLSRNHRTSKRVRYRLVCEAAA